MFSKRFRIQKSKDYANAYKLGKKKIGRYIVVFVWENQYENHRFGIVTSKKTGKAVVRNKIKRRLRAILESSSTNIKGHYDIVIVARYNIGEASFDHLKKDMEITLRKAGLT